MWLLVLLFSKLQIYSINALSVYKIFQSKFLRCQDFLKINWHFIEFSQVEVLGDFGQSGCSGEAKLQRTEG